MVVGNVDLSLHKLLQPAIMQEDCSAFYKKNFAH